MSLNKQTGKGLPSWSKKCLCVLMNLLFSEGYKLKQKKFVNDVNRGKKCLYCNANARIKGVCINCYEMLKRSVTE